MNQRLNSQIVRLKASADTCHESLSTATFRRVNSLEKALSKVRLETD